MCTCLKKLHRQSLLVGWIQVYPRSTWPALHLLEQVSWLLNKSPQHPHFVDICIYTTPEILTVAFRAYLNTTTKHQPHGLGVAPCAGSPKAWEFPLSGPSRACLLGGGVFGTWVTPRVQSNSHWSHRGSCPSPVYGTTVMILSFKPGTTLCSIPRTSGQRCCFKIASHQDVLSLSSPPVSVVFPTQQCSKRPRMRKKTQFSWNKYFLKSQEYVCFVRKEACLISKNKKDGTAIQLCRNTLRLSPAMISDFYISLWLNNGENCSVAFRAYKKLQMTGNSPR